MKIRLRWPIASYECDYGHTIRHWQKPWYVRRTRGTLSEAVEGIEWPSGPIFAKEALVIIGKTTET